MGLRISTFKFSRVSIFCIALTVALSCTRAPEHPKLRQYQEGSLETVVIGERLTPKVLSDIFKHLNHDGKLNSLIQLFDKMPQRGWESLSAILSNFFYENAFEKDGGLNFLQETIEAHEFSKIKQSLTGIIKEPRFKALKRLFLNALRDEHFPSLVEKVSPLIEYDNFKLAHHIFDDSNQYKEKFIWENKNISVSSKAITDDLITFFSHSHERPLIQLLLSLQDKNAFLFLFNALSEFRKERGSEYFEALGWGLSDLIQRESLYPEMTPFSNQLEGLLYFLKAINQPSRGLFETLRVGLIENELAVGEELELTSRPFLLKTFLSIFKEKLKSKSLKKSFFQNILTNENKKILFCVIRDSFTHLLGPPRLKGRDKNAFHFNLPIYLNSVILTEWISALVSSGDLMGVSEDDFIDGLFESRGFALPKVLIKLFLDPSNSALGLKVNEGSTLIDSWLQPSIESDDDPLKGFLEDFKTSRIADYVYLIPNGDKDLSLSENLLISLDGIHATFPFGSLGALFKSLLFSMTRDLRDSRFDILDFEAPNMLHSLNRKLIAFEIPTLRSFKSLISEELGFLKWEEGDFDDFLNFFKSNPEHGLLAKDLLVSAHTLFSFDTQLKEGLPTAFEFYLGVLRHTPQSEMNIGWVGDSLSYISEVSLASGSESLDAGPNAAPPFPSIHRILKDGSRLARTLFSFSGLSINQKKILLRGVQVILGDAPLSSTLELILYFIKKWCLEETISFQHSIDWLKDRPIPPVLLSQNRITFIREILMSEELKNTFVALRGHLSREDLIEIIKSLKYLSVPGLDGKSPIEESAELLGWIKNERIQKMSRVLRSWIRSNEWLAFLSSFELFMKGDDSL